MLEKKSCDGQKGPRYANDKTGFLLAYGEMEAKN